MTVDENPGNANVSTLIRGMTVTSAFPLKEMRINTIN